MNGLKSNNGFLYEETYFNTEDGKDLYVQKFNPIEKPKAVIQITHGMTEHSGAYLEFIRTLISYGFGVIIHDHRGHGRSVKDPQDLGYFEADKDWDRAIKDIIAIAYLSAKDVPLFLLGHSMGSFMARKAVQLEKGLYSGLILSGTGGPLGIIGFLGKTLAKLEMKVRGAKARSPLMNKLAFGQFNRSFKPAQTDFDWLSSDPEQVKKYIDDPLCGYICTTSFYYELLKGIIEINKNEEFENTPQIPIYLFSGSKDPVGNNGKGVMQVYNAYKKAGIKDITLKLYPEGRHEMLHEVNRQKVYQDIIQWLYERIPAKL